MKLKDLINNSDLEKVRNLSRKENIKELTDKVLILKENEKINSVNIIIYHELIQDKDKIKEKVSLIGFNQKDKSIYPLEFDNWENWINYSVSKESLDKFGKEFCLAKIIDYMTILGENEKTVKENKKLFGELLKNSKNNLHNIKNQIKEANKEYEIKYKYLNIVNNKRVKKMIPN